MDYYKRLLGRMKDMFINEIDVGKVFGVQLITSSEMNNAIKKWHYTSIGKPIWLDSDDDVNKSVNMAKHISDTRAKLTTLDIGITVSGSARADYLNEIAQTLVSLLPEKIEDADRYGGILIKWNGESWDFVLPGEFGITSVDNNGKINGVILQAVETQGAYKYTRLEYHRYEGKDEKGPVYIITNKVFRNHINSTGNSSLGRPVSISSVVAWAHIKEEVRISNLDKPLFAFYRVPGANTIDSKSPLGLAVFENAMTELEDIDIAIARKGLEVKDSKHITFVGAALIKTADKKNVKLPRFVKGVGAGLSDNETKSIHEHTPTLHTEQRIKDINFNLSMAGVKCGFSEGVFVLDGQTGMITATQVESDDRDTIQTIKNDRDALKTAIDQALQAANALATLYGSAPEGEYEVAYKFGDITYNYEEDKAAWKSYVSLGWVPKWLYFVKFEGMSEKEAKKMVAEAEASQKEPGLFDDKE